MNENPFASAADKYAKQYGVDPSLYRRLIQQESGWNPSAVSPVGARGLTQVMPATAKDPGFGVDPLTDPSNTDDQLRFGAQYLSKMQDRYDGDTARALAAYNAGPGVADKWGSGVTSELPDETQNYIDAILGGKGITKDPEAEGEGLAQNPAIKGPEGSGLHKLLTGAASGEIGGLGGLMGGALLKGFGYEPDKAAASPAAPDPNAIPEYKPDMVDGLIGKFAGTGLGETMGVDPEEWQRGSKNRAGLVSGLSSLGNQLMGL